MFNSQVFYDGATVNLSQDDVVLNSVVKSVTEHWTAAAKGELFAMT